MHGVDINNSEWIKKHIDKFSCAACIVLCVLRMCANVSKWSFIVFSVVHELRIWINWKIHIKWQSRRHYMLLSRSFVNLGWTTHTITHMLICISISNGQPYMMSSGKNIRPNGEKTMAKSEYQHRQKMIEEKKILKTALDNLWKERQRRRIGSKNVSTHSLKCESNQEIICHSQSSTLFCLARTKKKEWLPPLPTIIATTNDTYGNNA